MTDYTTNHQFTLAIDTNNDAFGNSSRGLSLELSYILARVASQVKDGAESGSIRDSNGNRVGEWSTFSQAHAG